MAMNNVVITQSGTSRDEHQTDTKSRDTKREENNDPIKFHKSTSTDQNDDKSITSLDSGIAGAGISERDMSPTDVNATEEKSSQLDKDIILEIESVQSQLKDGVADNEAQGSTSHKQDDGLPIDRGWAWMILAGSFLNVILMVGYARAIGILFVEYLKIFEASATTTTLFMGVMAATFSISSLFSMNLILQILGERKTVLLGAFISTLGMLTAVFATSITFLICTHSILIGIGHSMIHSPGLVLIGKYFKKRRGLATAISMSGISLGGSIFPPLIRYLVDEYGIRGSMLLLTGMTMNLFVGGLLYRPLDSFRAKTKKAEDDSLQHVVDIKEEIDDDFEIQKQTLLNEDQNGALISSNIERGKDTINLEINVRKRVKCNSEQSEMTDGEVTSIHQLQLYSSHPDIASMSMLDLAKTDHDDDAATKRPKKPKSVREYLKMVVVSLDFSMFKHPMFQLIAATSNIAVVFGLVGIYLPALAKEKGVPPTEASFLLTICGSLDFFSRLSVGYLADLKCMKVHHLMALGLALSGTATHFSSFYNSYPLMVTFSVLVGLFGSFYHCLVPVYVVEFMGLENMAKVLGFVAVFHGFSISVTHPIMGAIRDLTGSYNICFNYIGTCNYIAAICLLCEPLARRRVGNSHTTSNQEESKEREALTQK